MLGLDTFYEFKFQNLEEKITFALRRNEVNDQLLNLWQEVAGEQTNKVLEWWYLYLCATHSIFL